MGETFVTLFGNIATDPRTTDTPTGVKVSKFRLACTASRRDTTTGVYSDGVTSWYSVTCWRDLARNVATSFSKGQPVMIHGKQVIREWSTDDGRKGTEVSIEAVTVGHDLRWGESTFRKIRRTKDGTVVDENTGEVLRRESDQQGIAAEPDYDAVGDALAAAAAPLVRGTLDSDPSEEESGWRDLASA